MTLRRTAPSGAGPNPRMGTREGNGFLMAARRQDGTVPDLGVLVGAGEGESDLHGAVAPGSAPHPGEGPGPGGSRAATAQQLLTRLAAFATAPRSRMASE